MGGSVGPYGACQFDKSEYHGNYVDKMNLEVYKLYSYLLSEDRVDSRSFQNNS